MRRAAPESRSAEATHRREELVLAAYELLADRGFEGLRTRDVAEKVGVNIATLHYYFPTKEALIRAVVEHAMNRFRSTLEPHGSPKDQLMNHLRAVRRLLKEEPELGLVMAELALRAPRDEKINVIVHETYANWQATLRGLLNRAAMEGAVRPGRDREEAAAFVLAVMTSLTLPIIGDTPRADLVLVALEDWLTRDLS